MDSFVERVWLRARRYITDSHVREAAAQAVTASNMLSDDAKALATAVPAGDFGSSSAGANSLINLWRTA